MVRSSWCISEQVFQDASDANHFQQPAPLFTSVWILATMISVKWKLLFFILFAIYVLICITRYIWLHESEIFHSAVTANQILDTAVAENTYRIRNVETVCQKYNLGLYKENGRKSEYKLPPTPQNETFYYDKKHGLLWCPIYKAASSTWLYNFALLSGYSQEEIENSEIRTDILVRQRLPELKPDDVHEELNKSLKFMVVRHPFERILSAYRDKLENVKRKGDFWYYYNLYGSKIVRKYRPGGNATNAKDILKPGQYYWTEEEPLGIEPTFQEFVRYLIDTDLVTRSDDHWIPYYLACTPCLMKYDIIAKLETMLQDQLYIIDAAKLDAILKPIWKHKLNPTKTIEQKISELAKLYFKQLSKKEVAKLYQKYELDFELFSYKADEYYIYATS